MVTKTKTEPEAKAEEETSTDEPTIKKSELVETVKEILGDLLPGKGGESESEESSETSEPTKRLSARDEEEHTRGIVAEAIAEFKKALGDKGEKEAAPVTEPEKVPGSTTVRKVEAGLWGKE